MRPPEVTWTPPLTVDARIYVGRIAGHPSHTATVRTKVVCGRWPGTYRTTWLARIDERRGGVTRLGEHTQTEHRSPEAAQREAARRLRAAAKEART